MNYFQTQWKGMFNQIFSRLSQAFSLFKGSRGFHSKIVAKTAIIFFLFIAVFIKPSNATTYTVTNNNNSGSGSLRDAISKLSNGDNIDFNLSAGNETITIQSALDNNNVDNVTINGDNSAGSGTNVTVEVTNPSTSSYPAFDLNSYSSGVTLKNMTIRGGSVSGSGGTIQAGFFYSLKLVNCTIKDGRATSNNGGGIYFYAYGGEKKLEVINSTFESNKAKFGGGLYARDGDVIIKNSTFKQNSVPSGSSNGVGAGAFFIEANARIDNTTFKNNDNHEDAGGAIGCSSNYDQDLIITNSTINNNSSEYAGGGIYWVNNSADRGATITNCTIYNNETKYFGGGIYLSTGTYHVTNVTVAENSVTSSTYKNEREGLYFNGDDLYIQNTILANNNKGDFYKSSGTVHDNGYNIVEYTSNSYTFSATGNKTGNQSSLNVATSLANNSTAKGTQTLKLKSGSVAVDAGNKTDNGDISVPSTDQRGYGHNSTPDIGSYERNGSTPYEWTGSSGSSWNNSGNWNQSSVPGSGDIAIIKDVSNSPSISSNQTVKSVTVNHGESLTISSGNTLTVEEDIQNYGSSDIGNGKLKLSSSSANHAIKGSSRIIVDDLEIDNTNNINMETTVEVENTLTLTNGILRVSDNGTHPFNNNELIIIDNATVSPSGGTSSEYVDGTVKKKGDDAFTFPIGDGSTWARLEISAPSNTSDAFEASYDNSGYGTYSTGSNLNNVSTKEYWTLDRTNGSSSVDVTLYWEDGNASEIDDKSDLTVAHWKSGNSQWEDEGGSTNSGSSTSGSGSITVTGVSSFSPFTFGSGSSSSNPLPVELLNFRAKAAGDYVNLKWTTASETNNSQFIVQKRVNDDWISIGRVKGHGTTTEKHRYSFVDPEFFKGRTHYYRLKQVNFDGSHEYSDIRSVRADEAFTASVNVYPNPVSYKLTFEVKADNQSEAQVIIRNIYGQEIYRDQASLSKGENINNLPVKQLKNGQYILILKNDQMKVQQRFMKVD